MSPAAVLAALLLLPLAPVALANETGITVEPRAVATAPGGYYTPNRPPLQPTVFMRLPPGSIKPQGWLRLQLELDAQGLCGRLPEVSRFLNFESTGWVHPEKSGWEEVSYWLRGYAALGYALGDGKIIAETRKWVEAVMATQQEDGYFGPGGQKPVGDKLGDPWGHMPMFDVLRTYYEYTHDKRALECLTRYFHWLDTQPVAYFRAGWAATRWADTLAIVHWLYNVTGEPWVLDLAKKIYTNTVDYTGKQFPTHHNVNLAQGIRQPAQYWLQAGESRFLDATEANYRKIMDEYGQFPGGGFAGDESLRPGYTDPRQGFETCGIVESMRTFEIMMRLSGQPVWADRVEELAFNSLPAALTPDHRGIHYITCANSPALTVKGAGGQFCNKFTMLAYRPGAHDYRCCPHNYGMGWPNYSEEMWLATADKGLAASLYGAGEVKARVGEGTEVSLAERTDYPFSDTIDIILSAPRPVRFPLHLRIPGWCRQAEIRVNGEPVKAAPGPLSYVVLNREWKNGDQVTLRLPMALSVRRWAKNKNSASVDYGPLAFSLLIPEKWERGGGWLDGRKSPATFTKSDGGTDVWPEYEVRPAGPWNYGLILDGKDPLADLALERRPGKLAGNPFTQEGAPLLLKAKARRIPGWTLDNEEVVTRLESSPVRSGEPVETVTLIPMGAARLRISAFPVIGAGPEARPWGGAAKSPSASGPDDPDSSAANAAAPGDYPFQPVPFNSVQLQDAFWLPRIETTTKVTLPYAFTQCEGRIANFRRAAKLEKGHFIGSPYDDSDLFKAMEGAAYALACKPDPELGKRLDELIALVAKAQEPDGYLYTARTIEGTNAPGRASQVRWLNEMGGVNGHDSHELYNIGHMIEAAVAHYVSTGKRTFLDVATKAADLLCKTWGPGPDQLKIPPGHQEIELALVKLGRATGQDKYIGLSEFLLDCRGHYRRPAGGKYAAGDTYYANEVPVEHLTTAVGHSVRTAYMLSGMTDIAALRKKAGFQKAAAAIWDDTVSTKLYLHGGLGSGVGMAEGFGNAYELPNNGYNETCAAVANCLWNHRMFLLSGDAKYLDVLERSLYNNVLSGISLAGDRFFYPNPLVSKGGYARKPWFGTSCCPVNLCRFLPSMPGLIYSRKDDRILVGLYAAGTATLTLPSGKVKLTQRTSYPWEGKVSIAVEPETKGDFEISLRIPGWAQGRPVPGDLYRYLDPQAPAPVVKVNGQPAPVEIKHGFTSVRREWKAGDTIDVELPMSVRRVLANDNVAADRGRVALERGPVVYCVEGADFGGQVDQLWLADDVRLSPEFKPELLGGVMVLAGTAHGLYRASTGTVQEKPVEFTAIPYYAWENRGAGAMAVWLPRMKDQARPCPPSGIASQAPTNTAAAAPQGQADESASAIHVKVQDAGRAISPTLWGVFFEDINFGADGGLYAEMVKNRGFEFPDPMMGWIPLGPSQPSGTLAIRNDAPFNAANPHYLRIEAEGRTGYTGLFGVANDGFRGMGVRAGEAYDFSAQIRQVVGKSKLRVELYSAEGQLLDKVQMEGFTDGWKHYSAVLHPKETDGKAKLHLYVEGASALDLDMVSLCPEKTWKNRPGGLRADLVQLLADLKPGFLRFPGGCIVEGVNLAGRYQWKNTLGAPEERKLLRNRWSNEFPGRVTPDYFQSFGLGFLEYFQLCEDIGAAPLPILNCGMACQFNSGELAPLDQLAPYIQDALDLIEFANGPADSKWGSRRAALGHPAPFGMKFLGIGNENWGPDYVERYAAFAKALKASHPEITLVASAGPSSGDPRFTFMWEKLRELKADVVDEHSYGPPKWFYDAATRYDMYPRTGPKVCVGEYAARGKGARNTWEGALAEAAFMTGLERNGDVIVMSAYAPLLAHVDAWQWHPDLIWFDNLRAFTTPNYQVQKLFSAIRGDVALPVQVSGADLYVSATADKRAGGIIIKVVNASAHSRPAEIVLDGARQLQATGSAIVLSGSLEEETSPGKLCGISATESPLGNVAPKFRHLFPPHSVSVLRLKGRLQK